ncbi:MAG TPA: hypothetical protein DDZ40_06620 [Deltaproteobacteria bacterium]|nr:hypothetical protein [Deltaproteobacteria bacterium]
MLTIFEEYSIKKQGQEWLHSGIVRFFCGCLVENGLRVNKVILFGAQSLQQDAEIRTIRKFLFPLGNVTMTPEEWESRASIIAEHAKKGKVIYAA